MSVRSFDSSFLHECRHCKIAVMLRCRYYVPLAMCKGQGYFHHLRCELLSSHKRKGLV